MTILDHTFIHLNGFKNEEKERDLWRQGIMTHDQLSKLGIIADNRQDDWYERTKMAIAQKDHNFFATALPKDQHYRLAVAYPNDTIFLDIETTGLSRYYDNITIVGWTKGQDYKVIVHGRDDPGEFYHDLATSKALVTFNGRSFDVPFLNEKYQNLAFPKAHADLRFICKKVGLTGGQKMIEYQIGLRRHEGQGDGARAVELWYIYKQGRNLRDKKNALRELVIYNFADIDNMKHIFDACLIKMTQRGYLPVPYEGLFKPLSVRPNFENNFPCCLDPF
jgi:uncharacterized protein YprB with RNaseH-like and TPR domain